MGDLIKLKPGRGGARPGAGRKKGKEASERRAAAEKLKAEGTTPLEYMVGVLRGTHEFEAEKFEAAKHAAPYMHARLAAIEHSGEIATKHDISDKPVTESEWAERHAQTSH